MFRELFSNNLVQDILMLLVHHLWLGLGLFLAVALMLRHFDQLATTTRYRVWALTLLAVAVLPMAALIPKPELQLLGKTAQETSSPAVRSASLGGSVQSEPLVEKRAGAQEPIAGAQMPDTIMATTTAPEANQSTMTKVAPARAPFPWPSIAGGLLIAWLLGVCWKLSGIARGLVVLHRVKQESRPYPCDGEVLPWFLEQLREHDCRGQVSLRVSSKIACPVALGFRGPAVVLPDWLVEKLDAADLKRLILHELAHIKRRDDWANLGQKLVEACFFYHPGVRGLSRGMDLEREVACDSWAVSVLGDAPRYARCLVHVFETMNRQPRPVLAVGALHTRHQLSRRVDSLLKGPKGARFSSLPLTAAMLLLFAGGYLAFSFAAPKPRLSSPLLVNQSGEGAESQSASEEARSRARERQARLEEKEMQARERALQAEERALARQVERLEKQKMELMEARELEKQKHVLHAEQAELAKIERLQKAELERMRAMEAKQLEKQARLEEMQRARELQMEELHRRNEAAALERDRVAARMAQTRGESISISNTSVGGDESSRMHFNNNRFEMKIHGRVVFSDDESDIESVSRKGLFELKEKGRLLGKKRWLRVRANAGGGLTYDYQVNGRDADFETEGRAWLREVLPSMLRDTAINAFPRMTRILEQQGVDAAFDYVDPVESDYARGVYYRVMIESDMLGEDDYTRLSAQAAVIDSDYEKARVYKTLLGKNADNIAMITQIASDLESIDSDYEKRGVLSHVIETGRANDEVLGLMMRAAAGIDSDYEKARFLKQAIDRWPLDTLMERGLLEAATGIDSDYEHAGVLMAIFSNGNPTADQMETLLEEAAESIGSDYEQAKVFTRAARIGPVGPAYFKALRHIGSDYEKARVLKAVAASENLSEEQALLLLETAKELGGDHEKYTFLRGFINDFELTPPLLEAVRAVMKTIGSDFYHGKLSRQLDNL